MRRSERPILSLPPLLLLGLAVLLALQVLYHHLGRERFEMAYQELGKPLSVQAYRGMAMGSEQLLGYLLAIRLQLHDNQAGRHFRYSLIDYHRLIEWLERISVVSPGTEYPMLLASRVYSSTLDREQLRLILDFIQRRFDDDPQLHWRRLAEASVLARHRLDDLELALAMAGKLARQPASVKMPGWARDIEILLLAELDEHQAAVTIIEAMLQSNAIIDPDEKRFLESKLLEYQQKLFEFQQSGQN